jgi:heavy metal sensor kinase
VLSRLPIRVRLTLVFATTMLFVLSVAGVLVYERVRSQLDAKIDVDVSRQAASLLSLVESSRSGLAAAVASPLVRGHQNFVQVIDRHGRILAATDGLKTVPLLKGKRLQQALTRSVHLTEDKKDPLPAGARLISTPVQTPGHGTSVLIVGTSLDQRSSSLENLAVALGAVGGLALLVATGIGYRLTAATLRPVEHMRRRAEAVSVREPGLRLPLPAADDEIRHLGNTLNEMLDRLEESFAREQIFVANASHELRTPLSTLKTELDLALRRERPAEELRDALRSAQHEVDRLSALADDLLVLARADGGQLPVAPADLEVGEVLGAVRDRFDPGHDRVQIVAPSGIRIHADPQRIEQAMGNLLDNALRYSDGAVTLAAGAGSNGAAGVELHVEDHGPGFPPQFLERAFERFSRADPGRAGRGAGLGLSIVQMIARAHGGEAHAANRTGGGADVWIVIPRSPGA